jgi:hypothetical protein
VKVGAKGRMMSGMDALIEGILAQQRQNKSLNAAALVSG